MLYGDLGKDLSIVNLAGDLGKDLLTVNLQAEFRKFYFGYVEVVVVVAPAN